MAESVNDNKAMNQFFDVPASDGSEFEGGLSGTFVQESTEFYTPSRTQTTNPDPVPVPAPTPEPPAPDAPGTDPDAPPTPSEPMPDLIPKDVDYASENLTLKQKIAELELYKPLGDMIQRNPNFLSAVEQSLKSLPKADAMPEIPRPTPPQKPAAYDVAEAMSVPGSESWKFREATETYQHEMFNFFEKRDAQRDEIQHRAVESYQAQQAQMQAQASLTHVLTARHGFTPDRVDDFIKTMNDPASRSIENLVTLYNMQLAKRTGATAQAQKAAQKNVPLPAGITGGGGVGQSRQLSDSDLFNLGLSSARR
jgi:hypothetical protein